MPNVKHLYYFYRFSQELSTTKAAKRLGISPAALSNQLKELSEALGLQLTKRSKGKVIFTEQGEMVRHYADRMFSCYDDFRSRLFPARDSIKTSFRAGICQNIGARFSFDLLSLLVNSILSFSEEVHITYTSSNNLLEGFRKDQFDLILGGFAPEVNAENSWISQTLTFPVRLFAPPHFLKGVGAKGVKTGTTLSSQSELARMIELANSKRLSLVLPTRPSALRDETERFLLNASTRPAKTIECNGSSAIVELIERGFAMGLVPTPCLLDFKSADSLTVLGPPEGYWNHGISVFMRKGEGRSMTKISPLDEIFSSTAPFK